MAERGHSCDGDCTPDNCNCNCHQQRQAPPPPDAITLAAKAVHRERCIWCMDAGTTRPCPAGGEPSDMDRAYATAAIDAAAPVLRAEGAKTERQRIRDGIAELMRQDWSGNGYMWPDKLADLLDGDDDQPPNQNRTEETHA